MWVFFLSHCICIIMRCYIIYTKLTPYVEGKKTRTQSKNSNKKIDSWVFVRNCLCMKWSLYKMIPLRVYTTSYKNPCSKRLLCFCTKWSPLYMYEVVFVRSDCQSFLRMSVLKWTSMCISQRNLGLTFLDDVIKSEKIKWFV